MPIICGCQCKLGRVGVVVRAVVNLDEGLVVSSGWLKLLGHSVQVAHHWPLSYSVVCLASHRSRPYPLSCICGKVQVAGIWEFARVLLLVLHHEGDWQFLLLQTRLAVRLQNHGSWLGLASSCVGITADDLRALSAVMAGVALFLQVHMQAGVSLDVLLALLLRHEVVWSNLHHVQRRQHASCSCSISSGKIHNYFSVIRVNIVIFLCLACSSTKV